MSEYVRVSFHARELKKAVNEALNTKIKSLTRDRKLGNALAREYGEAVTPFVPRSNLGGHHMQTFYVSDNRVTWSRPARQDDDMFGITKGDEIASILYDGPLNGKWNKRPDCTSEKYGPHNPTDRWAENVQPGTPQWDKYVEQATIIIKDWLEANGNSNR